MEIAGQRIMTACVTWRKFKGLQLSLSDSDTSVQ